MVYPFYIILGFIPSVIWLSFYLRKDAHPEPNSMVLRIFIWGMLLAPLAIILEIILIWLLNPSANPLAFLSQMTRDHFFKIILASTLVPALVEEYLKYSVVKYRVLKNPEFDEPVDAMLYCIIAGLGFATVENLLILLKYPLAPLGQALGTTSLRFLGATLVHALASGMVGYWLARGLLHANQRKKLILTGLTIAIIFHGCYNYLIITTLSQTAAYQKITYLSITVLLLVVMVFLVSYFFRKLKKQQAICQTTPET